LINIPSIEEHSNSKDEIALSADPYYDLESPDSILPDTLPDTVPGLAAGAGDGSVVTSAAADTVPGVAAGAEDGGVVTSAAADTVPCLAAGAEDVGVVTSAVDGVSGEPSMQQQIQMAKRHEIFPQFTIYWNTKTEGDITDMPVFGEDPEHDLHEFEDWAAKYYECDFRAACGDDSPNNAGQPPSPLNVEDQPTPKTPMPPPKRSLAASSACDLGDGATLFADEDDGTMGNGTCDEEEEEEVVLTAAAVDRKLRRLCTIQRDGSYKVTQDIVDQWKDQSGGGRSNIKKIMFNCGGSKDWGWEQRHKLHLS
jgi:hypothetical protein